MRFGSSSLTSSIERMPRGQITVAWGLACVLAWGLASQAAAATGCSSLVSGFLDEVAAVDEEQGRATVTLRVEGASIASASEPDQP